MVSPTYPSYSSRLVRELKNKGLPHRQQDLHVFLWNVDRCEKVTLRLNDALDTA